MVVALLLVRIRAEGDSRVEKCLASIGAAHEAAAANEDEGMSRGVLDGPPTPGAVTADHLVHGDRLVLEEPSPAQHGFEPTK
jgi:hypothetical protein